MTSENTAQRPTARRKPRIALLGEFSAGKSTLANILMEEAKSPVRVTATQVPPIWYSEGGEAPKRIAMDGSETPLEGDDLSDASLDDTCALRVFLNADILELCDLIDMPGSSDPNMTAEIWDGILPLVDGVIWCTPATQAWRQSEAAIWEDMPDDVQNRSVLLLTRIDKVLSEEDRQRLVSRVRREVDGLFRAVVPVSLTDALAAGDDIDQWAASGMGDFSHVFLEIVEEIDKSIAVASQTALAAAPRRDAGAVPPAGDPPAEPVAAEPPTAAPSPPPPAASRSETGPKPAVDQVALRVQPSATATGDAAAAAAPGVVLPRRVARKSGDGVSRPRPQRRAEAGSQI